MKLNLVPGAAWLALRAQTPEALLDGSPTIPSLSPNTQDYRRVAPRQYGDEREPEVQRFSRKFTGPPRGQNKKALLVVQANNPIAAGESEQMALRV
jgi:hypothetical protein